MIASLFVLSSCGKFTNTFQRLNAPSTTQVSFAHIGEGHQSLATANGGLMIYAVNTDQTFGRALALLNEANTKIMTLPNGSYTFYGISWDGANHLEGQARCAQANGGMPITLTGAPITISLTYSIAGCNFGQTSIFGPSNSSNGPGYYFYPLNFTVCTNFAGVSCSTDAGLGGSARVIFEEAAVSLNSVNVNPEVIVAGCVDFAAGVTPSSSLRVPLGAITAEAPNIFVVTVEIMSGTGCTGSILREYEFNDGLGNPSASPGLSYADIDIGTSLKNTVYLYRDF